ncbi:hypothetical protein ARTHRO9AX_10145 [Arthrobacter sp. 9AX]|nr:hypothetical protein ARTHRO9AX_10145 [Arthrobacter sp. 9AX]
MGFEIVEGSDIPAHMVMLGSGAPRIDPSPTVFRVLVHGEHGMGRGAHRHRFAGRDRFGALDLPDKPGGRWGRRPGSDPRFLQGETHGYLGCRR